MESQKHAGQNQQNKQRKQAQKQQARPPTGSNKGKPNKQRQNQPKNQQPQHPKSQHQADHKKHAMHAQPHSEIRNSEVTHQDRPVARGASVKLHNQDVVTSLSLFESKEISAGNYVIPINVRNLTALSKQAQNYQRVRYKKMRVTWQGYGTYNVKGNYVMSYCVTQAKETGFSGNVAVPHHKLRHVSVSDSLDIDFSDETYLVSSDDATELTLTPGYVQLSLNNCTNDGSNVGKLDITYEVELVGVSTNCTDAIFGQAQGNVSPLGQGRGIFEYLSFEKSSPAIALQSIRGVKYLHIMNTAVTFVAQIEFDKTANWIRNAIRVVFRNQYLQAISLPYSHALYRTSTDEEGNRKQILVCRVPPNNLGSYYMTVEFASVPTSAIGFQMRVFTERNQSDLRIFKNKSQVKAVKPPSQSQALEEQKDARDGTSVACKNGE